MHRHEARLHGALFNHLAGQQDGLIAEAQVVIAEVGIVCIARKYLPRECKKIMQYSSNMQCDMQCVGEAVDSAVASTETSNTESDVSKP